MLVEWLAITLKYRLTDLMFNVVFLDFFDSSFCLFTCFSVQLLVKGITALAKPVVESSLFGHKFSALFGEPHGCEFWADISCFLAHSH